VGQESIVRKSHTVHTKSKGRVALTFFRGYPSKAAVCPTLADGKTTMFELFLPRTG
jgi:hypothetical protein